MEPTNIQSQKSSHISSKRRNSTLLQPLYTKSHIKVIGLLKDLSIDGLKRAHLLYEDHLQNNTRYKLQQVKPYQSTTSSVIYQIRPFISEKDSSATKTLSLAGADVVQQEAAKTTQLQTINHPHKISVRLAGKIRGFNSAFNTRRSTVFAENLFHCYI